MEKQDDGGSSGSSNSCPICIGPFHNESYLDKCFQKDGKRPTVASRKIIPLHQQTIPHTEEPSSKRQKVYSSTSSLVVSNLGSIAEPFIKDNDILAWQARSSEEVRLAMVKADLRVRIKTLEFEKKQLSKEFSNMKKKHDQLKKDSKASISRLQSDKVRVEKALENKEEQLNELEEVSDEQREQINLLNVDKEKGLSDSIAKIKKDSHIAGFRVALRGFLLSTLIMTGASLDKFCYNCILRWSEVVAGRHSKPPSSVKCPLCKTENISIIHGYDGSSFQKHYFNQDVGNSAFFSDAHKYRLQCYYIEPGTLTNKFNVTLYWKSNKYVQKNRFLFNWLRRELQALIQEEDVDIVAHHLHGIIDSLGRSKKKAPGGDLLGKKQEEFKALVSQAAKPFLTGRTHRFVEELELFLASGLSIEAYDKVYSRHLGWKNNEISSDDDEEIPENTPVVPSLSLFNDDDFE